MKPNRRLNINLNKINWWIKSVLIVSSIILTIIFCQLKIDAFFINEQGVLNSKSTSLTPVEMPDINLRSVIIETLKEVHHLDIEDDYAINYETIPKEWLLLLTNLNAQNRNISNIEGLNKAVNLEYIDLSHNNLTTDSLIFRAFNNLTKVKILNLSHNQIESLTDAHRFTGLKGLKELNLSYNALTTSGLGLTNKDLSSNKPATDETSRFRRLSALEKLDLSNNPIVSLDAGAQSRNNFLVFYGLSNLKHLNLSNTKLTNEGVCGGALEVFEKIPKLQTLNLSHNEITDISNFSGIANLKELDISHNNLGQQTITNTMFASFPILEKLDLSNNNIFEIEQTTFNDFTSLNTINLQANSINDISSFINLNAKIDIANQKITIKNIQKLNYHTNLISFDEIINPQNLIIKNNVLPEGWQIDYNNEQGLIFKLPDVANNVFNDISINFEYDPELLTNDIKFNGEIIFNTIITNQSVPIPDNGLRLAIIEQLENEIENLEIVKTNDFIRRDWLELLINLNASNKNIKDLTGLNQAINLKYINLSHNSLDEYSLNNGVFTSLNNLENLDLSYNNMKSTTNNFIELINLKKLNLSHNLINSLSANTFNNLTKLTNLDLSYNYINDITSLSGISFEIDISNQTILITNLSITQRPQTIKNILYAFQDSVLEIINTNAPNTCIITTNQNNDLIFNYIKDFDSTLEIVFNYLELAENIQFNGTIIFEYIDINLEFIYIPDNNLRKAIIDQLDCGILDFGADDTITKDQMESLTILDAKNKKIDDLTGLNYAINLVDLDLSGNKLNNNSLINLNLQLLDKLITLNLSQNYISDISSLEITNIQKNIDITNQLVILDKITSNTNLIIINPLITLNKNELIVTTNDNINIKTINNEIELSVIKPNTFKNVNIAFNYLDNNNNINFNGMINIKEIHFIFNLNNEIPITNQDNNEAIINNPNLDIELENNDNKNLPSKENEQIDNNSNTNLNNIYHQLQKIKPTIDFTNENKIIDKNTNKQINKEFNISTNIKKNNTLFNDYIAEKRHLKLLFILLIIVLLFIINKLRKHKKNN